MPDIAPQAIEALAHSHHLESDDARLAPVIGDYCPAGPQARSRLSLERVDLPRLLRRCEDDLVHDAFVDVVEQVLSRSERLIEMTGVQRRRRAQRTDRRLTISPRAEQLEAGVEQLLAPLGAP